MTYARYVLVADRLTPPQRHIVLRCSDAQEWGGSDGQPRLWTDVVHGYRHCSFRSVRALERRGVVKVAVSAIGHLVRLTSMGLSVQFELQCRRLRPTAPAQSTTLGRAPHG
jgi:hypothetical protein